MWSLRSKYLENQEENIYFEIIDSENNKKDYNNEKDKNFGEYSCDIISPCFSLPATSELRPSGLTMAAWLNEKGS